MMKRKRGVKLANAGLLLCLGMSVLTGCKNNIVDYDIDEVTESSEIPRTVYGNGETGLKQFADELANDSHWREEEKRELPDGSWLFWEVDAEISVPDVEQMYVVDVEESIFDEAEKGRLADKLFGDEIYYYDTEHLPKNDLAQRQSRYQEEYDAASETSEEKVQLEKKLSECEKAMKTAGDVYTPVDEYDVDEYLGKYEGRFYELSFEEYETIKFNNGRIDGANINSGRGRSIFLVPKDIYQFCPEEVSDVENLHYIAGDADSSLENQCELSEEVARELAQNFIESLELDYSVYAGSSQLQWFKGTDFQNPELNYIVDGYVLYYEAGIEDTSFVQYGTQKDYCYFGDKEKSSEELQYSLETRIEIYVNGKGIIGMQAKNPIKITHVTDGIKCLPLNTVKGIIKEYDMNNYLLGDERNELKLIYFRVRDKENPGYYSYIPVWRFARGTEIIKNAILINAIDGSVIDFYDEV